MRTSRWLALGLCLLVLPALQGGGNRRGAGGGDLCPGTFLYCQDFEGDSSANTCNGEGATSESGDARDCDCTTSTGCATTPRPSTIPEGTEILDFFNPSFGDTDETFIEDNKVDNADSSDTQYFRGCFSSVGTFNDPGFITDTITFRSDADWWNGTTHIGGVRIRSDSTPNIWLRCPDNEGDDDNEGTAEHTLTQGSWHEITIRTVESTGVMELCVDQAIGHGSCTTCDGEYTDQPLDGFRLYLRGSTAGGADGGHVRWDALRFSSSDPGATEGCSGL